MDKRQRGRQVSTGEPGGVDGGLSAQRRGQDLETGYAGAVSGRLSFPIGRASVRDSHTYWDQTLLNVAALLRSLAAGPEARLIETHISWVLLAGAHAYKIKKPVNLGFLDYSTLERRRFFCEEELRLDRRLAPDLYLDVVPITGTEANPRFGAAGPAIDYTVKMRRFSDDALLDQRLHEGRVTTAHVDAIARIVARFHAGIPSAPAESDFGTPAAVHAPVVDDFEQIAPRIHDPAMEERLGALRLWADDAHGSLANLLQQRREAGFVRECHGDMHLGNMAWVDDGIVVFDGIEFNDRLRWIHLTSEVAFLLMDFDHRARPDYGWRFYNLYLEGSGGYGGVSLLRYFKAYRAMVRAKVACLRRAQPGLPAQEQASLQDEFLDYVARAESYTLPPEPRLIITHGFSGAGKSAVSLALAAELGAVRLRSDVERKRLSDAPGPQGSTEVDLYSPEYTQRTYTHLLSLAEGVLRAPSPVIVDATFLHRHQREAFRRLAERLAVPFTILDVSCDRVTLEARVGERADTHADASDADLEVLRHQLAHHERLDSSEQAETVSIDGRAPSDPKALAAMLRAANPVRRTGA